MDNSNRNVALAVQLVILKKGDGDQAIVNSKDMCRVDVLISHKKYLESLH